MDNVVMRAYVIIKCVWRKALHCATSRCQK